MTTTTISQSPKALINAVPIRGYYVYVAEQPDGSPFYVGKGTGLRLLEHEERARSGCSCAKCHTIRSIWDNGQEVQYRVVATTPDEYEAYGIEADYIELYGLHRLTNKHLGCAKTTSITKVRFRREADLRTQLIQHGYSNSRFETMFCIGQGALTKYIGRGTATTIVARKIANGLATISGEKPEAIYQQLFEEIQ